MGDLPTPPYTEATEASASLLDEAVAVAATALHTHATEPYGDVALSPARAAIIAVNALVKAGLLLPEGAETRTEWGWDCGHPRAPQRTCVHPGSEEWARATAAQVWPDGALRSRWIAETPWAAEGGGEADQSKEQA